MFEIFCAVVLIACGVGFLFSLYMLFRNQQVYRLQREMIERVHESVGSWKKLSRIYHSEKFDYDTMMRKWWIPVRKFREEWEKAVRAA